MDLAHDERVKLLNEEIQTERDPRKLNELVDELAKVVDELRTHKPADPAA